MASDISRQAVRNKRLGYAITACEEASFTLPIWILFSTSQLGLSITVSIMLGMARWLAQSIFTIPTGAWADRFGRVRMYRLGQFVSALSVFPYILTKNVAILFAAQLIGGAFGSMTVGVLKPLVKDGFTLAKFTEKRYKHYLSTDNIILYIARLLAGVVGGWAYSRHAYAPYVLQVFMLPLALLFSFFLIELRVQKSDAPTNRQHIGDALRYVWRHSYLRNFLIAMFFLLVVSESLWSGLQPIFVYRGVPTQYFGLLFGVVAILSAVGSYLSRKIPDHYNGIKIKFLLALSVTVGVLLIAVPSKWSLVAALPLLGLAFGFFTPIIDGVVQGATSSKYQSTVMSLASFIYLGGYALVSVLVGRYLDVFGTAKTITILVVQGIVCTAVIAALYMFTPTSQKQDS